MKQENVGAKKKKTLDLRFFNMVVLKDFVNEAYFECEIQTLHS